MRPVVAAWLERHGLPGWVAPSYAMMVGLVAILGLAVVLERTKRERDDVRGTALTLMVAYVAALLGGYVYEALRVTPEALLSLSIHPYLHVGRAAYGGLLVGTIASLAHLRHRRADAARFFDRVALVLGAVFLAVRTGCLLEGCDYGVPTDGALAVSYPPESLAAVDHAHRGWVALGTPSLGTHPVQLYEGLVAVLGSGVAVWLTRLRDGGRAPTGAPFLAWLIVYGVGRALVETLRGDASRGVYGGVSSAQYTSLVLVLVATAALVHSWRALSWRRPRGADSEPANAMA